jgi:hypothetical protein
MMRTGWKWDFAIPTRSVGGGIIRRAGVVVLGILLGSETLSKVIINVVVRYFWVRGFFALCRWWRWCCGLALNRGRKEPGGDGETFQGFGGSCAQVLVVVLEIP